MIRRLHRAGARLALLALVSGATLPGCGERPEAAALGGDIAARVGGTVSIPADLVARTAAEAKVSRDEALARLVGDAVGAREAIETHVDERPDVRSRVRASLARGVTKRLHDAARAEGPPRDDEIAELTAEAWYELDRPEMRVSVHAVVLRPSGADEAKLRRATQLADKIHGLVVGAKSPEEFLELAKAPTAEGLEVKVEGLEAVAKDGRLPSGGSFDLGFVRALFAIQSRGDTSPVAESAFGYHVIRLVEIVPPFSMPLDERRALFADEAASRRARRSLDAVLVGARQAREVTVSPAAATILGELTWGR